MKKQFVTFREASNCARVSLPNLIDIDWHVNMIKSSHAVKSIEIPSVVLQLDIADIPMHVNQLPMQKKIHVELNKESLDTMLEGLGKIRDQLSAMG